MEMENPAYKAFSLYVTECLLFFSTSGPDYWGSKFILCPALPYMPPSLTPFVTSPLYPQHRL